jgi:hypothetical protein
MAGYSGRVRAGTSCRRSSLFLILFEQQLRCRPVRAAGEGVLRRVAALPLLTRRPTQTDPSAADGAKVKPVDQTQSSKSSGLSTSESAWAMLDALATSLTNA